MTDIATIDFHGDRLFVFEQAGTPFVAMRPIVEALGLDWHGQRQRIHRDDVLSEGAVMIPSPSAGGQQDTLCLPLHLLNGWLFGVDAARVKPELRERIKLYRRECFQVLADHFGASTEADEPELPTLYDSLTLQERRQLVNEARVTFCRQSARELWLSLGLPTTPAMLAHTGRGPAAVGLREKILEHVRQNPGQPVRVVVKKFQQHGYMKTKAVVDALEREGHLAYEVRRPSMGGRPATFVSVTTH